MVFDALISGARNVCSVGCLCATAVWDQEPLLGIWVCRVSLLTRGLVSPSPSHFDHTGRQSDTDQIAILTCSLDYPISAIFLGKRIFFRVCFWCVHRACRRQSSCAAITYFIAKSRTPTIKVLYISGFERQHFKVVTNALFVCLILGFPVVLPQFCFLCSLIAC